VLDRRKKFEFEFNDLSPESMITFDYDEDIDGEMNVSIESGIPIVYANKQAFLTLAKAFILPTSKPIAKPSLNCLIRTKVS
jgi:hypothetical protein